ncbi:APC family permease [Streptomyces cinerochromogenes]|uniref:APC family permease n=1 Tax=Streptomyces cinerochromogenes TaxID=66422 RepID=UPI0016715C82|nr:APC family permease [Streptomyces cinerochromogenes]GGS69303.1 hypothetical protein GCM10010206_34420 [Streptomyces cinerochromogenes]
MNDRPPAADDPARPALRRSLGVLDGVAVAASSTAATTSIGIGLGVTAGVVGPHLPAIMLLAFLPVLGIAGAYARLDRVEPNAGNGYVWVGRSLSPWLGFTVGWVNLVASVAFLAYTTAVTGSALLQLAGLAGLHRIGPLGLDPDSTAQTTAVGVLVLAAVTVTAVTGVRTAARLQTWLLVFEYAVLLGFCGYGVVTGPHPFRLSWFDPFAVPSATALAQGLLLAVFCYWGFEAAFTVTEEVRAPRDASRAGLITLVTMLGLFLLGSVAFQRVLSGPELAGHGARGLAYYGDRLAGQPLAALPLVALMFSAVASLQAGVIPTARGAFAMSRDRTLGPVWSRVSARYGTPAAGTLLIGALALTVAVGALVIPRLADLITATVNAVGIVVALSYALTALAAAVRFRSLLRTDRRQALRAVVSPALGALALLALGGYLGWSFYTSADHLEVSADNGWFLLLMPLVMIVSGFFVAGWAKWVRKSPYFTTGAGTDADSPKLLTSSN